MTRIFFTEKIDNERGVVLVIALVILCLMTIIATAVSDTSSIETMISGVEKDKQEAFYVAEAGVDHVKGLLNSLFVERNTLKIAAGQDPDWDFALDGSEDGINAATGTSYDLGALWITEKPCGDRYTYSVRVWDNSFNGSPTDDDDGIIYIRSVATGPQGEGASIEVAILGTIAAGAGSITGYIAQAGAGPQKNYTSEDAEAISDFTQQI